MVAYLNSNSPASRLHDHSKADIAHTARAFLRFVAISGATVFAASIAGCGRGGDKPPLDGAASGTAPFQLASHSLGDSSGEGRSNCIAQSQSLSFIFNEPVRPDTVTSETLQILEVDASGDGAEPAGQRLVSGNTIIFTPEVSFDSNGNVRHGFKPGRTYRITIPNSP
ncbi:MAG: Ig-like domain-containing protein [Planctomycetes bacterium]|nr:Ig-like domain-containing protein [Planctomycetota bacterium]